MLAKSGIKRGYGSCSNCFKVYSNRNKPPKCECGHDLGGKYIKKEGCGSGSGSGSGVCNPKDNIIVYDSEVDGCLLSIKLTQADDRQFGYISGSQCICYVARCLELRNAYLNSKELQNFQCPHLVREKSQPILTVEDFKAEEIDEHILDKQVSNSMKVLQKGDHPTVVKVSNKSYVVIGNVSTSSPMGYYHVVQHNINGNITWKCSGNECNIKIGNTKQVNRKKLCLHKQFVILCRKTKEDLDSNQDYHKKIPTKSEYRATTVKLHSKRKLPYHFQQHIICMSDNIDSTKLSFQVSKHMCELCGHPLSESMFPQGCCNKEKGNGIMITNRAPFQRVEIKIKKCLGNNCGAINTVFPLEQGLYNICNKILISLDILLEWREFFKKGFPLTNIISCKLEHLKVKCNQVNFPTEAELEYVKDLLYDGFYGFEAITERNLDDVICGLCGVVGKVYYGDGNEKNCCKISEIVFDDTSTSVIGASLAKENESSLEYTLETIKDKLVEKSVFTGVKNNFKIHATEVPPLIPEALRHHQLNTESHKKSIYLKKSSGKDFEGDPILLSQLMIEKGISSLENLSDDDIALLAKQCGMNIGNKSKDMIKHDMQMLHETLITGKSSCHGFSQVPGHTGGFYHIVCPHGTTVCSKFMLLSESVRDPADLWLSLKYPPVMFVCDTPCTFVRHINMRKPDVSKECWGDRNGCFEKPRMDKNPSQSLDIPTVVPNEYLADNVEPYISKSSADNGYIHPLTGSTDRYICGDRFHSKTNPHKSHLCLFHNIDLCSQATTLKTSYQESLNKKKNERRNRSSCNQSIMVHIFYNYLMNYYENEEIIMKQKKYIENSTGKHIKRDSLYRFVIDK